MFLARYATEWGDALGEDRDVVIRRHGPAPRVDFRSSESSDEPRNHVFKHTLHVTDVPRGSVKHVRFTGDAAIQDLRERAEKILAIRESEELAEEAVRLGRMVSSDAPLY